MSLEDEGRQLKSEGLCQAYQKAGQRLHTEIEAIPELMVNEVTVNGTMPISHLQRELKHYLK